MEPIGAAASVLAIATAGIQVSLKLIAFADQVATASRKIEDVGTDVSVTAGTLQELGEFMNLPTKRSIKMFLPHQVRGITQSSERCSQIFEELKTMLSAASHQLRDRQDTKTKDKVTPQKLKLSRLECMKWPFLQPSMDPLRSELRDAKATLTLMLQVVNLRYAQATSSLNQDEQEDLKRMIIAMKRQQLASEESIGGGEKELPASDREDIFLDNTISAPEVRLEAWSVHPNTWSGESDQPLIITQLPISQETMFQRLKQSPQSYDSIGSMIDGLSPLERKAVWSRVLRSHDESKTDILSMTAKGWYGSHSLFGDVKSRKLSLIVERRTRLLTQPSRIRRSRRRYGSSSPEPQKRVGRRRGPLLPEQRIAASELKLERLERLERLESAEYRPSEEQKRLQEEIKNAGAMLEKAKKKDLSWQRTAPVMRAHTPPVQSHMASPGSAREVADDDLIEHLLTEFTDFDSRRPGRVATPPPSYREVLIFPKKEPRPY